MWRQTRVCRSGNHRPDGTAHIGTDGDFLYACTDNGDSFTERWSFTLPDVLRASPAIGGDGTVYYGSADTKFYAVTDCGTAASELWSYSTGGEIWSSQAIGANGTVYVGSHGGKLYAFGDPPPAP